MAGAIIPALPTIFDLTMRLLGGIKNRKARYQTAAYIARRGQAAARKTYDRLMALDENLSGVEMPAGTARLLGQALENAEDAVSECEAVAQLLGNEADKTKDDAND